jgi:catechol 2,3-dioxygenase-like lactoylglutathione lyase family enzyme
MRAAFDHLHIYSADVDTTIAFYTAVLGGELLGNLPTEHEELNHFVLLGGQLLVISRFPPGLGPAQPPPHGDGALRTGYGVAHFGLNVADLGVAIGRLRQAGIEPHAPPAGSGKVRYVYVTAPDGVVIELTQYRLPPRLSSLTAVASVFNNAIHWVRRQMIRRFIRW